MKDPQAKLMVEIHKVLIQLLQGLGPHFIWVSKRGKEPIDKGWTTNPMCVDEPKISEKLNGFVKEVSE